MLKDFCKPRLYGKIIPLSAIKENKIYDVTMRKDLE